MSEPPDPFGRHAWFSQANPPQPPEAGAGEDDVREDDAGRDGRRAFFSGPPSPPPPFPPPAPPPPGPPPQSSHPAGSSLRTDGPGPIVAAPAAPGRGQIVIVCRTCLARTPVSAVNLAARLVGAIWLPTRKWPVLMVCPHCRRRNWCRLEWPAARQHEGASNG